MRDGRRAVAALFLCAALSSPGQTFVLALYLESLIASLDVTRAWLATGYAIATFIAAAALMPFGHLADRLSSRRFLVIVLATIAAGMALLAGATRPWHVLAAFILLRLAGQGAVGVGLLTAVVRHFPDGRGRSLSLANLGYSAGEALFPFLVLALISVSGWRQSLGLLVLAYVGLAIPAVAGWLHDPPGSRLGRAPADPASVTAGSTWAAVRTPVFWIALLAFAVLPVGVTALFFHQVALFRAAGIGETLVPLAFALYAVSHAGGMAVAGRWIDGMSPRLSATLSTVGMLAAIGVLVLPVGPVGTVVGYAVLLGCSSALSSLGGALVWPILFGPTAVGSIRAVSSALRNGATAVGPLLIVIGPETGVPGAVEPLVMLAVVGLVAAFWLPGRAGTRTAGDGRRLDAAAVDPLP